MRPKPFIATFTFDIFFLSFVLHGIIMKTMQKINSYIITGPTASGKSDFAHKLAKAIGGVVINCDSVQMYKGVETIAASPLSNQEPGTRNQIIDDVTYKLFSILPLTEQISVADYLELARGAIDPNRPAIFVGGTGFYINALLHGISPIPNVSDENRARAREIIAKNPEMAVPDPQRAARALEVLLETGKPIEYWQSLPRDGAVIQDAIKILINPPRGVLLEHIAARIPVMIKNGALDEASEIAAKRAIGADEILKYKRGETDEKTMIENWITRTNQYAKRQRTWFAHQFDADIIIDHVPMNGDLDAILRK
jgi:tRNA dimethylallyltransferase